jgi:hypothetical protein
MERPKLSVSGIPGLIFSLSSIDRFARSIQNLMLDSKI